MRKENIIGYMVIGDNQPIFNTDDGNAWRGGGDVFIPLFVNKDRAKAYRYKIQQAWKYKPYSMNWYKIVPVKLRGKQK